MFLASALNKNRALPTFKDKTIWIYPSGYGLFPDVQKDCYPLGLKDHNWAQDPPEMNCKFCLNLVLVEIRL